MDHNARGTYNWSSKIKFKTAMSKLNWCICCDVYTLVKGVLSLVGAGGYLAAEVVVKKRRRYKRRGNSSFMETGELLKYVYSIVKSIFCNLVRKSCHF